MEADSCYRASSCDETGLIRPIYAYSHEGGDASVTGGYVYRGSKIPALVGTYLFTDYYPRPLWALIPSPMRLTPCSNWLEKLSRLSQRSTSKSSTRP